MERQKRRQKSRAKMAGVKSTFVIGQDLLMTSFGERDKALLEKQIQHGNVKNLRDPEAYKATYGNEKIAVTNADSKLRVKINNPLADVKKHSPEAEEYSKKVAEHKKFLKQRYEEIVFGMPYNDNIHIQVISKILDIEKTFSFVIGNIVYAINNLNCKQDIDNPIDYMVQEKRTDENLINILPRCEYLFDLGFEYPPIGKKLSKEEREVRDRKNIETLKNALSVIAYIRNDSFHGFDDRSKAKAVVLPSKKYNIPDNTTFSYFYALDCKLRGIKANYSANSKVNINFLSSVLYGNACTDEQKEELAEEYFNFAILKQYKNIGFSLTSLREQLLSLYNMDFEGKKNLRARANSFCDYVLYAYYRDHDDKALDLVNKLRSSANDKEKEQIYIAEANALKDNLRVAFKKIENFDDKSITVYSDEIDTKYEPCFPFEKEPKSKGGVLSRTKADRFCNMAYYLTQFLDGKEINVFLTTLHNIFENIASFLGVMDKQKISYDFTEKYTMFYDSAYIVKKLETVISVSRMKKALDFFNHQSLVDAIDVLGVSRQHGDLEMKDYIDKYLFDDNNDSKLADHSLRNFLVTNVIHSRKFNYLARYCNMATVSNFAKNRELVKYVLKRVDPKQIDRYYQDTCGKYENISTDEKIDKLIEVISDINVDNFEDVNNAEISEHSNADEASVAKRNNSRACVGLYLNVLYQIVKNMMNVNSRYSIAFAMTERDMIVEGLISNKDKKDQKIRPEYIALTKKYLDEGYIKCATDRIKENIKKYGGDPTSLEHIPGEYLRKNMECYCEGSTVTFRNAVAHLVLMTRASEYVADISKVTSYFALYHYCMQKHILYCAERHNKSGNEKMTAALTEAKDHHSYSKNAVKYLCLPFAYNVARYKALTIEGLFDWTEYGNDDK